MLTQKKYTKDEMMTFSSMLAAGVSASKVTLGIPGMARAKKIITDYYMGGTKK